MKTKCCFTTIPALLQVFGFLLTGCSSAADGGDPHHGGPETGTAFTVKFEAGGGNSAPVPQTIDRNGYLNRPELMTKAGWVFLGWYKDPAFTARWDFENDTVSGDMTLYANWEQPPAELSHIAAWLRGQRGGNTGSNPISLPLSIDLDMMIPADSGWKQLLTAIATAEKFVELDLSACAMLIDEFSPDPLFSGGKEFITALILPNEALGIAAGSFLDPSFKYFSSLKSVEGPNIKALPAYAFQNCGSLGSVSFPEAAEIGAYALLDCGSLNSVSFPEAESIGISAFQNCPSLNNASFPKAASVAINAFFSCTSLTTLDIPRAATIVGQSFANTGNISLVITMGTAAPSLGTGMFNYVAFCKNVTVKVPAGAAGYDAIWQNGFKDENPYITLNVSEY
jgi:uncharacterized repeat protein (TIGR02543 family)